MKKKIHRNPSKNPSENIFFVPIKAKQRENNISEQNNAEINRWLYYHSLVCEGICQEKYSRKNFKNLWILERKLFRN